MNEERRRNFGMAAGAVGLLMALHHQLNYGKWCDNDKEVCHGKAGLALVFLGFACLRRRA